MSQMGSAWEHTASSCTSLRCRSWCMMRASSRKASGDMVPAFSVLTATSITFLSLPGDQNQGITLPDRLWYVQHNILQFARWWVKKLLHQTDLSKFNTTFLDLPVYWSEGIALPDRLWYYVNRTLLSLPVEQSEEYHFTRQTLVCQHNIPQPARWLEWRNGFTRQTLILCQHNISWSACWLESRNHFTRQTLILCQQNIRHFACWLDWRNHFTKHTLMCQQNIPQFAWWSLHQIDHRVSMYQSSSPSPKQQHQSQCVSTIQKPKTIWALCMCQIYGEKSLPPKSELMADQRLIQKQWLYSFSFDLFYTLDPQIVFFFS